MAGTTQTTICNRALQLCGSQPINSINDNSRGARALQTCYQSVLYNELRSNFWGFSLKRAILAASTTVPSFGPANYYPLPADFLMLAPQDEYMNFTFGFSATLPNQPNANIIYRDYKVEQMPDSSGMAIVSDQPAPLYIRYISSSISEGNFDPSFAEAFACALAIAICEELTQNTQKLAQIEQIYMKVMAEARKRNAYEKQPTQAPVDPYIVVRL